MTHYLIVMWSILKSGAWLLCYVTKMCTKRWIQTFFAKILVQWTECTFWKIKTGHLKRRQKYIHNWRSTLCRNYFILLHAYYLIIWRMKWPKNFLKIAILKMWGLVSFWGVKTHFGKLALNWGMTIFLQNLKNPDKK